jgi:hypothetical protein
VIARRTVLCLGVSQLVSWGVTYYLIGGFGEAIAADLGWSRETVHGGFAVALLVMGLVSPLVGRAIDRHGGAPVMTAGSIVTAIGCVALASADGLATYYAAWLCLGIAMRFTLYDAAFAALARIGGMAARRPIAQITLLGGLASTVFWPLGHALMTQMGWRGAVLVYAGIALLTVPLHLAIAGRGSETQAHEAQRSDQQPLARSGGARVYAACLYALIVTLANFLNSGMSAHMIGMLAGLGLAATTAVWIASLRGIGQSMARLAEVLFAARVHPLHVNLLATLVLPFAFGGAIFGGQSLLAALAFALVYGAGNGVLSITRGTVPLVLFDTRIYGSFVGWLLMPGFVLSAAAPVIYALVIRYVGEQGAFLMSAVLAAIMVAAAVALAMSFAPRGAAGQEARVDPSPSPSRSPR